MLLTNKFAHTTKTIYLLHTVPHFQNVSNTVQNFQAIAFGIRNIHYTKAIKDHRWADYILEFIELSSLILADLAGAAMTLIFCIRYSKFEKHLFA